MQATEILSSEHRVIERVIAALDAAADRLEAGEAVRPYVARGLAAGASMIVTVPMAGYVSADKAPNGDHVDVMAGAGVTSPELPPFFVVDRTR